MWQIKIYVIFSFLALEETCLDISVDVYQGGIRHARIWFYPHCQINLWCWQGSLAFPRPKTGCWGRIVNYYYFVCVCVCVCVYWGLKQHNLLPVFVVLFLSLSHQCVRLCCLCVFEGLCVMSKSKVWIFSKSELFWVESFILTWIQDVWRIELEDVDLCLEFRKKEAQFQEMCLSNQENQLAIAITV